MRAFRFRAQAALDLRRREHDQALVHLARSEAAHNAARQRVEQADRQVLDADAQLLGTTKQPTERDRIDWYRNWRVKCRLVRDDCERQRLARAADVREAMQAVAATHRRVRSLERLREIALAGWQRAADQEEMKLIDALATARFARRKDAV